MLCSGQVRAIGGLLVIGTSIQESRRSENQLKGRAGRQGDPGETLMMYDLQDRLMQANESATQLAQSELRQSFAESIKF